jgi:hypothetical protein
VGEYDPLASFDQSATAVVTGSKTVSVGPTPTTTAPGETAVTGLFIATAQSSADTPPAAPWNHRSSGLGTYTTDMADQDVAALGTFSATWQVPTSTNLAAAIATYVRQSIVHYWNGSAFVPISEAADWNGSTFAASMARVWNGTAWSP